MSKRDTPLLEGDVLRILGITREEYEAAVGEGRLRRSVQLPNDPTSRLVFHNFWDVLEFSLTLQAGRAELDDEFADLPATEVCDDLAFDGDDIVPITGDGEEDLASFRRNWALGVLEGGWPARLADHCAGLMLRTAQHIQAVGSSVRPPALTG